MSWNFLTEESRKIEEEVMAEIMTALNLNKNESLKSPTAMIAVPELKSSPQESTATLMTDTSSYEDDAKLTLVKVKKDSPKSSRSNISLDGSAINDSFVDRMNFSTCSSLGGSSDGTYDSQKYYIGTVNEEDETCSVQSHVSNFGTDEMSNTELIEVVHTLYRELKNADRSLSQERKRRHSREKSLIKLAKELKKRKDTAAKHLQRIKEMQQEIIAVQSEKALIEQRLEVQKQKDDEIREISRRQFDQELHEKVQMYEIAIAEHDHRILEINQRHANQCEQLCREVVEANQEVVRLQKVLFEVSRTYSAEDGLPLTTSRSSRPLKSRRYRGIINTFGISIMLWGAAILGYHYREIQGPVSQYFDVTRITTLGGSFFDGADASFKAVTEMINGDQDHAVFNDIMEEEKSSAMGQELRAKPLLRAQSPPGNHVRGALAEAAQPFKWLGSRILNTMRPGRRSRRAATMSESQEEARLYDFDVRFFE
eukprot:CAMPEP_0176043530 /NCGR_PEP_ID=MMETSP0120_2-20121206/21602_1 /TAXON_ID=160619 /ORGANISM="Kryptoperidinium foliaceum, Strain CCMP 1326" /LENGTH=482 /DNA_ID=CAMNT_0017376937 /DNA_START=46 /DNA_END=1494 /DNA_ORIENTATION=-